MVTASEIRPHDVLKIDGKACRVLSQEIKGTGKFGKTVHLKIKVLEDGHVNEKTFRAEEKVENAQIQTVKLQYLYRDGDNFMFMNNQTYDQVAISAKAIGRQEILLKENSELTALFEDQRALTIDFPKTAELKVVSSPAGLKGQSEHTYKEVGLENGLTVLAPQFIKEGEMVRINTDDFTYMDRVTVKSMQPSAASSGQVKAKDDH